MFLCDVVVGFVQVGRVQFYPKRVPPASFLWLGQTSHDNQNIIMIIIIII